MTTVIGYQLYFDRRKYYNYTIDVKQVGLLGEKMKSVMKNLVRNEKGAALIISLILLLIGGLISAALLNHMGSGILAGVVHERRTAELYAADAGVEDAIWKIQHPDEAGYLPCSPGSDPRIYTITDINGRNVQVTIEFADWSTYKITSRATTDGDDSGGVAAIDSNTAVESYVYFSYMDFSSLLDNALVSDNSITIHNGVSVTGNVTSGGTVDDKTGGDVDGTITQYAELDWPSSDDLSAWYLEDVKNELPYTSDTIDIVGVDATKGPLYRDGPLTIKNSSSVGATLELTGTLYITGDTKICYNTPNNNEMVLDLNGQTIFVASDSMGNGNEALQIGDKCTIIGSGCIIAVGDIYFKPNGDVGGADDFVLVMSIEGTTILQPSGIFYGCIAGNLCVDAKSGEDATIVNSGLAEGQGLNFPMGMGDDPNELPPVDVVKIDSWEIIQQ